MGNAALVQVGPGVLRAAPLGTAEPVDHVVAYPSGWVTLGFTETGHDLTQALTATDLYVAESFDPVRASITQRKTTVNFTLAEITALNLTRVLNNIGGAVDVAAAVGPPAIAAHTKVEPPDVGTEVHTMLAWDSDDGLERWIYRECLQVGTITAQRRKGVLTGYAASFTVLVPASNAKLYKAMFAPTRKGT